MKDAIQILLAAALGAALLYLFMGREESPGPIETMKIKRDTSYIERIRPRTVFNKIRPSKFIRSKDSAVAPARFSATLDTITNTDSITLSYTYPENEFTLGISPKPDTLPRERIILMPEERKEKSSGWLTAALGVGAAILGLLLGLAIN
ncbi:MAG: hypothetical protein ACM3U1_04480 [Chloroflexota bacterium]